MNALIVTAHPLTNSLTHAVAQRIAEGVRAGGTGHAAEIADLHAEGFNPRFDAEDMAAFRQAGDVPKAVRAEQQRIDRSDALVLVYPVYWWSMPALMKGWIDRVFIGGWAFDELPGGGIRKRLQRLPVHLVALAAADAGTYERHGYAQAMHTQIDHGIFGFCGAPVRTNTLLVHGGDEPADTLLARAQTLGTRLFDASAAEPAAQPSSASKP